MIGWLTESMRTAQAMAKRAAAERAEREAGRYDWVRVPPLPLDRQAQLAVEGRKPDFH